MLALLNASDVIDGILARIARLFGWLFIALVIVICWDVLTRKLGFQIPGFGSTPIQELEWHLHGRSPWVVHKERVGFDCGLRKGQGRFRPSPSSSRAASPSR